MIEPSARLVIGWVGLRWASPVGGHVEGTGLLYYQYPVLAALGGSTDVVLHLLALAGRAEVQLCLQDLHEIAARVPLIVNVRLAGEHLVEQRRRRTDRADLPRSLVLPRVQVGRGRCGLAWRRCGVVAAGRVVSWRDGQLRSTDPEGDQVASSTPA